MLVILQVRASGYVLVRLFGTVNAVSPVMVFVLVGSGYIMWVVLMVRVGVQLHAPNVIVPVIQLSVPVVPEHIVSMELKNQIIVLMVVMIVLPVNIAGHRIMPVVPAVKYVSVIHVKLRSTVFVARLRVRLILQLLKVLYSAVMGIIVG